MFYQFVLHREYCVLSQSTVDAIASKEVVVYDSYCYLQMTKNKKPYFLTKE